MLVESDYNYDIQREDPLNSDEQSWLKYVALKTFLSDLQLPNELGPVYAYIYSDEHSNPVAELRVVDHFSIDLSIQAYRIILEKLGEQHSLLISIKTPEKV